jgi:hypothetical protein
VERELFMFDCRQGDSGLIKYIHGNDSADVNLRAYFYIDVEVG